MVYKVHLEGIMKRNRAAKIRLTLDDQETFSTFDVLKILGLKRGRLRQWMDRGFITGFTVQWGSGEKTLFGRVGLYHIELFRVLVDSGLNRAVSFQIKEHVDWMDVKHGALKNLLIYYDDGEMRFIHLRGDSAGEDKNILELVKTHRAGHFVNLRDVVERVDSKV